jgi:Tfp pilus assembly protein PilF
MRKLKDSWLDRRRMRTPLALLAIALLSVTAIVPSLAADNRAERYALVIGNAKYPDAEAPLKEPINDARELAGELKRNDFDVEVGENLTGEAMHRAFERLYGRLKPGTVALVFFSGFGIQSNRQSFMIPVDAQIWTEADVRRDGVSLETVLGEINSRGAGAKIGLIDASRRNPFERRFRSFSAGLAPVIAPNGTLVMYSAALSSVISDTGGDHSPFVQELLKHIRVPDLMAEETLNRTRIGVTLASHGEQVPWISSSLAEDFSFIPGAAPNASGRPSGPALAALAAPVAPEPEPPPAPKPAEVSIPAPDKPADKADKNEGSTAAALADDPTINSLKAKLADNPDDQSALYRRGQVYASRGAYDLALKDFDDTLRLNPKDVEALNTRCWTRTVIGELQAALKDCNEALRLRPNFVDALDSRGLVNLKGGQVKNAITDYDAALKINPRLTSSLYGRGLAKQRNGAIAEGELDIANAKAMDPNIVKEFAGYGIR